MKKGAFTLIELSIVLIIIGILTGGSFAVFKSLRESAKISEAKEQIKIARNAVLGYVLKWPNLPSLREFQNDLSPAKNNQNAILYAADVNLSTINNDVCAYQTTNLQVIDNGVTPPRVINNVAFVLAHESANYNMQTALDTSSAVYNVKTYGAGVEVDDNTTTVNRVEIYDDVVEWVTLDELHQNIGCHEKMLKILNDPNLPRDISTHSSYVGARLFAEGGVPFADSDGDLKEDYEWCVEDSTGTLGWMNSNSCNGAISLVADCSVATFKRCTSLVLGSLSNPVAGAYRLEVYARDQVKEISKSFTLTVDAYGGDGGSGTLPNGSLCSSDGECASGSCNGGVCANPQPDKGDPCDSDADCMSGNCNTASGKCK